MPIDKNYIITKTTTLKNFWRERDKKMRDWYEQIRMVDTLAQKDMESFVGNDPRASLNLIRGILNQRIPHRLPAGLLSAEEVQPAADLSSMFDYIWENVVLAYRQRGKKWQRDFINLLLATGWYAVFASIAMDGSYCIAEVLNPSTVYPMWDDVLTECARISVPGESSVRRMAARNRWEVGKLTINDRTEIRDYWWIEQQLNFFVVHNAVVCGNELVKPDTPETRFKRIPIFIAPVGGLPDTGELAKSRQAHFWKGELGQSYIATNENVYRTSNKWWTFIMQLLRDTAQARTYEKSNSPQQIVKPETWYRRGAHYKLGSQDEVGFIAPPPIPVELRSTQLDLEAMMQRGGPSWTMFGSIQQRMTAYAMAQVAATTNQIAGDFHQGVVDCVSDIDNFWYDLIKTHNYKPYGRSLPTGLPPNARISADYELRIPGDLIQRANTARILNPAFELSDERIYEEIFPEIKNPIEELARVQAGKARKHPVYAQLSLIAALRQEAIVLKNAKDYDGAALFEKAAERLEQELMVEEEAERRPPPERTVRARPEALPPTEPREGGLR